MAKPIVPNYNPATEAPHEKKFKKNVDSKRWMTIKNGRMMPRSIKTIPKISRKRGEFSSLDRMGVILAKGSLCSGLIAYRTIFVQPASHEMSRLRLEVRRELHITQTRHEMRTARMKTTTRRRVHQTRRLPRRHFLEILGIVRIRVRGRRQQGMGVRMQRIIQQLARLGF